MRAVTWQGPRRVETQDVPDPSLAEDTDAIVQVSATAICGSDLHLYEVLAPYLTRGDILGHEAMGTVVEAGGAVTRVRPGDCVVIPFNIACGACWMCARGLQSQCEVTQVRAQGKGAALFGYTSLYGGVPGGQAEYVRVPHADYGLIPVPQGGPDERWLYLSDILPTAWQAARYADVTPGDTVAVVGLGPVGHLAARCALRQGAERVIGVDLVPERLQRAREAGIEVVGDTDDTPAAVLELTGGRGADRVIESVGMEAHGDPVVAGMLGVVSRLPKPVSVPLAENAAVDRLSAPPGRVRLGPPRWDGVDRGRVRRCGEPNQHDGTLRQAAHAAHGSGQRPPLERRTAADDRGGRRRLRHRAPRHPPAAP